jgi:VIT1/CCC1 family predicted Fe2+/Mn2+ transporter
MDREKRQETIYGLFDGVVSVTGFIFGLLVHHSPESAIAVGGLGGAIAAAISMGAGEIEKGDEPWRSRVPVGLVMFGAALVGSLVPVLPFWLFSKNVALIVAGIACLCVATWIGYEKRKGTAGYVTAYVILLLAAGVTLGVVSLIPQSV